MQKTKKILALCLSLLLLVTVSACKKEAPVPENPAPEVTAPAEDKAEDKAEDAAADEAAVRAVFETFADKFSKGDFPALAALFKPGTPQYETYKSTSLSALVPADSLGVQLDPSVIESFAKDMLSLCSFSVKTVTVEGNAANAVISYKMPDIETYAESVNIEALLMEFMKDKNYTAESLAGKTDAEMASFQNTLMADFGEWFMQKVLVSAPYVERDVNATLEKADDKWLITKMDALL